MKWEIQYRKKGDSNIRKKIFDLSLDKKKQVKKWFLSTRLTIIDGNKTHKLDKVRQDYVFIDCEKVFSMEDTCNHPSEYIDEIQGGQIERCRLCGKQFG